MAKIKTLIIEKFRGIKDLKVEFNNSSWVIHGRNGSGKSGVIDAIEFGLSGVIGRLTGEGRGDVSVKDHGPHVDSKTSPKDSIVTLVVKFPNDEELTIIRNCSNPTKPKLLPTGEKGKELYNKLYFGKEVVLSRRDILKFVLTEPGKRSKEVQSLLKIEKLEEIRSALQTLNNKVTRKSSTAQSNLVQNRTKLLTWLKIPELSKEEFLKTVNESRQKLGLALLSDLTSQTSVNEGVSIASSKITFYSKKDLLEYISDISKKIQDDDSSFTNAYKNYSNYLDELEKKENIEKEIGRLALLEKGLPNIVDDKCPLCETKWQKDELKKQIEDKIKELSGIKITLNKIDKEITNIEKIWKEAKDLIKRYKAKTEKEDSLKVSIFDSIIIKIDEHLNCKEISFSKYKDLGKTEYLLGLNISKDDFCNEIKLSQDAINKLPEKTDEDKIKEFLTVCQERLENYQVSKREDELHKSKLKTITISLNKYNQITESYLNGLYEDIESDFSRFYQIVNEDDEASFTGDLTADKGALDFRVDFYGRGKFPPAAYHSEGHQDGMGLCLYLALMKKILDSDFTIAILDDVLMSVDSSHRKSFCKLLKTEFSDTQFIITTHDQYWQKQMITEGLVTHASSLKFKNWSVDTGPSVWSDKESWEIINDFLSKDNVAEASSELRRFLEYYSDEVAIRIGAKVLKNATGDHGLGELLTAISSRFGDLLKKAKKSASSWDKSELVTSYEKEKSDFDSIVKSAQGELWAVNATVHFNKWADMDKNDFVSLKDSYRSFVDSFKCLDCGTLLHIVPTIGASESLKCDCGSKTYNLKIKK